mgnify:CR=1 FL=1
MEWQNSNNFDASESETAEAENNSEVPENETVEAEPEQPTYIFTGNGKYKINEKFERNFPRRTATKYRVILSQFFLSNYYSISVQPRSEPKFKDPLFFILNIAPR